MNFDGFRRRADAVRCVPLEAVLACRGAKRAPRDKSKWLTEQGPLSVTGAKFHSWHRQVGGGGAIDLVMHLAATDFRGAVAWLERHMGAGDTTGVESTSRPSLRDPNSKVEPSTLRLPVPNQAMLERVVEYLAGRYLPKPLIEPLLDAGRLYADARGNAVFLLMAGKPNRPVGAELRGTSQRVWRGMASGTRKDSGYFWVGDPATRTIVLCESAIDAISCYKLDRRRLCISTSGARTNPRWLRRLIACGFEVYCGYDADAAGVAAAETLIALHPLVQRLCPPAHDWNDALASF